MSNDDIDLRTSLAAIQCEDLLPARERERAVVRLVAPKQGPQDARDSLVPRYRPNLW